MTIGCLLYTSNLRHKDEPKPLLTEEEVELLTLPLELATYKDAIMEAMFRGTKRNIERDVYKRQIYDERGLLLL